MKTTTRALLATALVATALGVVAAPVRADAVSQPAGWGLGLMLGAPTGLTLKYWTGAANALDLGLGVGPGLRVHGDYLWGIAQLLSNKSDLTLDLYVGAGPVLGVSRGWCGTAFRPRPKGGCREGALFVGARVPFGLDARVTRAPVTFGLELAPGLWLGRDFVSGLLDAFLFVRVLL